MDGLSLLLACAVAATPGYMVRLTVHGLPIYLPEIFIILAFVWWLGLVVTRKMRISWPPLVISAATVVFVVGAVISTLNGGSAALGPLKSWVVLPVIFGWLTYQALTQSTAAKAKLEVGLLVSTVVFGLYGIYHQLLHGGRLESFYNSPNAAAMWLVPIFFLLLPRWRSRPFLLGLVLMVVTILLTRSLSGLVALVIGLIVYWLVSQVTTARQGQSTFVGSAIAVIAFSYFSLTAGLSQLLNSIFGRRLGGRLQIWQIARSGIQENFWRGIGPGTFQRYYFARIGLTFPNPIEWSVPEPHNLYLATWLSSGLIGFVGFFGLVLALFYRQLQTKAAPLFAALTAVLIHGLADTTYWKNDLSIIFFLIVALTFTHPVESGT